MEKANELENRIRDFCRQKELFAPGDRVLLGLSGGADSVCLFLVLQALAKEWELTLFPVHVNHNLRGEEAKADQRFCEELCRRYDVELQVVSVPVAELAKEQGWTVEEAGRNARYQAFFKLAETLQCNKTAVAHHKNDQAETVLFQLFRGSRLKGLSGMEAKNGTIIRPLLCVERKEIEGYLEKKQQAYCIDRTNLEEEYTRNRIRHRMVPVAEEIQPRAVEHIAETAEYLGRVELLLERLGKELYEKCVSKQDSRIILQVEPLQCAERLLAERVIYDALCLAYGGKKDITAGFVSDCMELLFKQTGRYITLPDGIVAERCYHELRIGRKEEQGKEAYYEEIHVFPYQTIWQNGLQKQCLTLELLELPEGLSLEKMERIPKSTYTKWFDYDKIKRVVSWKTPTAEDVIALYADGRGKRVLDVLKAAKVPKEEREQIRLLTEGTSVLWIPGIRGSEAYRVTEDTKRVLVATIDGGNENGR